MYVLQLVNVLYKNVGHFQSIDAHVIERRRVDLTNHATFDIIRSHAAEQVPMPIKVNKVLRYAAMILSNN